MSQTIKLKRSAIPGKIPEAEQLQLGEVAINTHDGRVYIKQEQSGVESVVEVGRRDIAGNVFYVSTDGSDDNDGRTIGQAFETIEAAVAVAPEYSTIFIKSGEYEVNNPITIPRNVALCGDTLRTTVIRPVHKTQDLFYVNNGAYIAHMTFKDYEAPAAAVSFNPDGSAGTIFKSPYVQNCTSITTTGTGMRVDGDLVSGLKSMVVDAYTQFNSGGIGFHVLNSGYSQLVSFFTICCNIGILAESGGSCSVTNSNTSFGNLGLVSDGVGSVRFTATVDGEQAGSAIKLDSLTQQPVIGDGALFNTGNPETIYYAVRSVSDLSVGDDAIIPPEFNFESGSMLNARARVLDVKSKIKTDTIVYINRKYPSFDYSRFKCSRDIGLIIDAIVDDAVLNTNYRSRLSATSYYRATASEVITTQFVETLDALDFVRTQVSNRLLEFYDVSDIEYTRIIDNLDLIIDTLNDIENLPALVLNTPNSASTSQVNAKNILQANRNFIIEEGIAFITENYPSLDYNESLCRRDIGFVIEAAKFDILYSGNSQSIDAAKEYYAAGQIVIPEAEVPATIATFDYIRSIVSDIVSNVEITPLNTVETQDITSFTAADSAEAEQTEKLFGYVVEVLENGFTCTVTFDSIINEVLANNTEVSFQPFSLITASGHTFEWVGAGINVNSALPGQGGQPIKENQVVETNGGRVFYTATDEQGDFAIGNDLLINRNTGTITGSTFDRSLFAVLTPYILAIED